MRLNYLPFSMFLHTHKTLATTDASISKHTQARFIREDGNGKSTKSIVFYYTVFNLGLDPTKYAGFCICFNAKQLGWTVCTHRA